ncbi:MAG: peptidoglycan DD-metalloendopeptidase family protein [Methylococcales bacterium]|nr:peptidoglycan DD-metalloendopeptidase family protein [Methylococcales bacterium]
MHQHHSKLIFFVTLIVLALLNISYKEVFCAPVNTDNNGYSEADRSPLRSAQHLNTDDPAVTIGVRKCQITTVPRNFHTMNLRSGYGNQRPASWNQKSSSYTMSVGTKIKQPEEKLSDNTQQNTTKKDAVAKPTKTIGSVTNKSNSTEINIHKKPPAKSVIAAKPKRRQQKSIDSIDNKKMLDLSFGWPIKGRVLKKFSLTRHKGIDIAGKQGQLVKAAEAGKVVYCGQGLIGFGNIIIIKHNDDYLSAYANTSSLQVNEGQNIIKGQIIAKVGDVGIKRTSLHFQIRKNGMPVNPLQLLPKK